MNYRSILSILFVASFSLQFGIVFSMKRQKELDHTVLERIARTFFVELFNKYVYLCEKEKEKELKIDQCKNDERFNESWDAIIMERSPVPAKIRAKEVNTYGILEDITKGSFRKYREVLKKELIELPLNGIVYAAIERRLRYCCPSFMEEIIEIKKKYRRLYEMVRSAKRAREVEEQYRRDIKTYKQLMEIQLKQAAFFLNQVSKMREHIFDVVLGSKDQEDREFREFVKYLGKKDYFCYATPKISRRMGPAPKLHSIQLDKACIFCGKLLKRSQEKARALCGHKLHKSCLPRWIEMRKEKSIEEVCPKCKQEKFNFHPL